MTRIEQNTPVLIITGLSGAGKTQVANCFEDLGYYCVDNLPPVLIRKFLELGFQSQTGLKGVALVIDVRGGDYFSTVNQVLNEIQKEKIRIDIIFMEADDEVLIRRFKESRRRHPLAHNNLMESIDSEREMLGELRERASMIIDTSKLNVRELNYKIQSIYGGSQADGFVLNIVSFGYKLGIPMDSDIIIDVRFLPNPYYDPKMNLMTGLDQEVVEYVLEAKVSKEFLQHFMGLCNYLMPHYINEGKSYLTIAVGCTGGQHRSVAIAQYCGDRMRESGYNTIIRHRDISKYKNSDGEL